MNKKLLLVAMLMAQALGINATYKVGDYLYTDDAKYKVIGENLITNGDFKQGLEGWTTESGTTLSPDTFAIDSNGPDGTNCMRITHRGESGSGGAILKNWTLPANGYFVFSYKVRSDYENTASSINAGDVNYQNLFLNNEGDNTLGSQSEKLAKPQTYSTDWVTVNYCFRTTPDANNLVMHMYSLYIDDCLADFCMYSVVRTGDERVLNAKLQEIENIINNEFWTEADAGSKTEMAEIVQAAKEMLAAGELDDYNAMNDIIIMLDESLNNFYDANTLDVTEYFENGGLTKQANKSNSVVGWETTGDRWNNVNKDGDVYARRDFPTGYWLSEGYCRQFCDLPQGKYIFSLDVTAYLCKKGIDPATGSTVKTAIDYTKSFNGIKIFINGDSTLCQPLNPDVFTNFTVYSDVKQDSALTVGIFMPGNAGQVVKFGKSKIRLICKPEEYVSEYFYKKDLVKYKFALSEMIRFTEQYYADNTNYMYGKTELRDSIDAARNILDTSTELDILNDYTNRLRNARKEYQTINAEFTNFVADIADADSVAAKTELANSRDVITKAIADANTFKAQLNPLQRDSAGIVNADIQLVKKYNDFLADNATFNTPQMLKLFTNQHFTDGLTGWDNASTNATIYTKTCAGFDDPSAAYYWRGTSIASTPPTFFIYQDNKIIYEGVYCAMAKVVAWNESSKYDRPESGIYMILGNPDETLDSTLVHASEPTEYALTHSFKTGETMRFGIDGLDNAVSNSFQFGDVKILYFGKHDEYVNGINNATVNGGDNNDSNIYNMQGQVVKANASSLAGMPKGVYIFKNRKVVIR